MKEEWLSEAGWTPGMASWVLRKKRHFITLGAGWPPCVEEDPGEDVLEVCAPRDPHCVAATATAGSAVAWRAQ